MEGWGRWGSILQKIKKSAGRTWRLRLSPSNSDWLADRSGCQCRSLQTSFTLEMSLRRRFPVETWTDISGIAPSLEAAIFFKIKNNACNYKNISFVYCIICILTDINFTLWFCNFPGGNLQKWWSNLSVYLCKTIRVDTYMHIYIFIVHVNVQAMLKWYCILLNVSICLQSRERSSRRSLTASTLASFTFRLCRFFFSSWVLRRLNFWTAESRQCRVTLECWGGKDGSIPRARRRPCLLSRGTVVPPMIHRALQRRLTTPIWVRMKEADEEGGGDGYAYVSGTR